MPVASIVAAYGLPHTPFFPFKVAEEGRPRQQAGCLRWRVTRSLPPGLTWS
jgi:hypothetical protein